MNNTSRRLLSTEEPAEKVSSAVGKIAFGVVLVMSIVSVSKFSADGGHKNSGIQ